MYKPKTKNAGICIYCNESFIKNISWQIYCSYKCGYQARNNKKDTNKNEGICMRCAKPLLEKRKNAIYCSINCKSMDHSFKHRSNTRIKNVARRSQIIARDNFICYLCGLLVAKDDIHLDHLIPVSLGGSNDEHNLAVTHSKCNKSRGVRMDDRQLIKLKSLKDSE